MVNHSPTLATPSSVPAPNPPTPLRATGHIGPSSLHATLQFRRRQVTVGLGGEIDIATEPDLSALLAAAATQSRRQVVLDLGDVEFMAVVGINQIVVLASSLEASGGELIIRSPSPLVRRMLRLTGLDQHVRVDASEPGGVEAEGADEPPGAAGGLRREAPPAATGRRQDTIDAALDVAVSWAVTAITSADSASIALEHQGRLTTAAASDETAACLDAVQFASGQGPGVHAATAGEPALLSPTVNAARWPDLLPHTRRARITAVLSTPLTIAARPVGALTLYSRSADAFGTEEQDIARLVAAHAVRAVARARGDFTAPARVDG